MPTAPPTSPGKAAFEQGEVALRQQKLDDARTAFQKALQLDDKLAPAHLRLAAIAADSNDAQGARLHLESAASLLPSDALPRLQLSQLYLQTQEPQKAETAAAEAVRLAKGPMKRDAQGNYARILTANKKEAKAYEVWTSLLKANSKDGEAALAAALLASEKLKRPKDADKWLAQAIKAPPANPQVSILLAQVLAGKKRAQDADKVLSAAAQKFPTFIPLHISLAELKLSRGDSKGSVATLRALLPKVPSKAAGGAAKSEVYVALAQALAHSGQTKSAISEAKNALTLQPKNPAVVAIVAEIFLGSGDSKSGIAALKTLLQLDPKNYKAHHILAGAYADIKQWDAAQKELDIYIKAVPQDLSALADKASLLEQRGQKEEALKTWGILAQKKPDVPIAPMQQARLLAEMQRLEPALERYKAVLKLVPKEPNALLGAAEIEEKRGDNDAALAHLKQFVTIEPKFDPAYAALTRVAKKKNQMAPTVEFLKTQLAKNADRRGAYTAILDYYESVGKAETGRTFVKGYIDKNPKLIAPRAAIEEFDLRRAKASLTELLKADKTKADKPTETKPQIQNRVRQTAFARTRQHTSGTFTVNNINSMRRFLFCWLLGTQIARPVCDLDCQKHGNRRCSLQPARF